MKGENPHPLAGTLDCILFLCKHDHLITISQRIPNDIVIIVGRDNIPISRSCKNEFCTFHYKLPFVKIILKLLLSLKLLELRGNKEYKIAWYN